MVRRLGFAIAAALIFPSILMAQVWRDRKPFIQWSAKEVDEVLNRSPWVALAPAGFSAIGDNPVPLRYRICLLTAEPVREAWLRRLSMPVDIQSRPDTEVTISAPELMSKGADLYQGRLDKFMATHPGDLRVTRDKDHFVLSISHMILMPLVQNPSLPRGVSIKGPITIGGQRRSGSPRNGRWENEYPDELMPLTLSDLEKLTFLAINEARKLHLVRYDPPGLDGLGAKFYFPRTLPDGSPFVQPGDKELRFETRIDGGRIKVKFDLRKMMYKGKLEI